MIGSSFHEKKCLQHAILFDCILATGELFSKLESILSNLVSALSTKPTEYSESFVSFQHLHSNFILRNHSFCSLTRNYFPSMRLQQFIHNLRLLI